jgi:hypothetical protein
LAGFLHSARDETGSSRGPGVRWSEALVGTRPSGRLLEWRDGERPQEWRGVACARAAATRLGHSDVRSCGGSRGGQAGRGRRGGAALVGRRIHRGVRRSERSPCRGADGRASLGAARGGSVNRGAAVGIGKNLLTGGPGWPPERERDGSGWWIGLTGQVSLDPRINLLLYIYIYIYKPFSFTQKLFQVKKRLEI